MRKIWILLLAALLLGCTKTPAATEPEAAQEPETAAAAFRFSTTDLDGNPVDESVFQGYDLVMINFWAYWCGPCVAEMPELEQLHQAYPNVLLLGVIIDETDMDETRSLIAQTGVTYPVLYAKGDLAQLAQDMQYVPTTYFLSPDGTILGEPAVGSNDLSGWTEIVEGYLK